MRDFCVEICCASLLLAGHPLSSCPTSTAAHSARKGSTRIETPCCPLSRQAPADSCVFWGFCDVACNRGFTTVATAECTFAQMLSFNLVCPGTQASFRAI
eukprot:scaffold269097_cov19-Tisochrysis_lutea.AAC.1